MPLPYRNVRYRFTQVSPDTRLRLAYSGNQIVETVKYKKINNKWIKEGPTIVREHARRGTRGVSRHIRR